MPLRLILICAARAGLRVLTCLLRPRTGQDLERVNAEKRVVQGLRGCLIAA